MLSLTCTNIIQKNHCEIHTYNTHTHIYIYMVCTTIIQKNQHDKLTTTYIHTYIQRFWINNIMLCTTSIQEKQHYKYTRKFIHTYILINNMHFYCWEKPHKTHAYTLITYMIHTRLRSIFKVWMVVPFLH